MEKKKKLIKRKQKKIKKQVSKYTYMLNQQIKHKVTNKSRTTKTCTSKTTRIYLDARTYES